MPALLQAIESNDLRAMNRAIRSGGTAPIAQEHIEKAHEVHTKGKEDPLHLLHTWALCEALEAPTDDETLRKHFKIAKGMASLLTGELNIMFLRQDASYAIEGLKSVVFYAPAAIKTLSSDWTMHEKARDFMSTHTDDSTDYICASHKGKFALEVANTGHYNDSQTRYHISGVIHWEEKPGAVDEFLRIRKPMRPAIDADKVIGMGLEIEHLGSEEQMRLRESALKAFLASGWKIDDPLVALGDSSNLLTDAAQYSQIESIEFLLKNGASKVRSTPDSRPAMSAVIRSCSPCGTDQEATLLALTVLGFDVEESDQNGETPLMLACREGKPNMAKILLDAGADMHKKNNDGLSALDLSKLPPKSHRGESCQALLDAHAASEAVDAVIEKAKRGRALRA
jgi:ankyrin repeat protein